MPLRWSHFWAVLQRTGGSGNLGPLTRVARLHLHFGHRLSDSSLVSTPAPTKVEDLWQRCKRYGFESRTELPLGQRSRTVNGQLWK